MKTKLLFAFLFALCILLPAVSSAQIIGGGKWHSVSVCSNSTARSWGLNHVGQLGMGSYVYGPFPTPGQVISVTGIIAVAAEGDNCLFLKNDSTVWGCGYNGWGDIGDGTTIDRHSPVHVTSLSGITKVDCGLFLSLFLKNDSTVWACGKNAYGTLGNGTYDSSPHPTPSQVLLTSVIAIAGGGEHSLFVKNDSTVWACGDNVFGELGIGTSDNNPHYIPVQVNSLTGIIAVESGWSHNLYLKNDGTVWACGGNSAGELGDGTTTGRTSPVQVNSLTGIIAMACGDSHSLFLKNDSTVWVCGLNNWGQLGDGTTTNKHTPVQLTSLTGIIGIAAGSSHSLFLKNDGTLWACGRNAEGQLGNGTSDAFAHPTP
ncbi:MAG: RCC1 repeat-containing protein, partial [Bacteroidota bacterium]